MSTITRAVRLGSMMALLHGDCFWGGGGEAVGTREVVGGGVGVEDPVVVVVAYERGVVGVAGCADGGGEAVLGVVDLGEACCGKA